MGGKGGGGGNSTPYDPMATAQDIYNRNPTGKGTMDPNSGFIPRTFRDEMEDNRRNYVNPTTGAWDESAWRAAKGGAGFTWSKNLFDLYYPEQPAPAPAPAAAPAPAPAVPAPEAPAPEAPAPAATVSPPPGTPQLSTGKAIEQPTSLGNDLASTVDTWTGGTDDQGKSLKKSKTMTTTQT